MIKTLLHTILGVCFLCTFGTNTYAQKAILKGKITDKNTGEALIAATISIGESGTTSDYDGNFQVELEAGNYTLESSYIGYESQKIQVNLENGTTQTLNIQLSESATLLQTATVSSGRYEKPLGEATVSLDVIKPSLIESNNSTSVDNILNKIPGVNIIDGQANIRGGSGYSYGAGSRVMLLIDDIPALQADAGRPNWNDIPVENIEQIEVIKGAASALYGSAALNGIVNVRTAYAKSDPVTKASVFYTSYSKPKDENKHWWRDTTYTPFAVGASFAHRQKFGKLDFVSSAYYLYEDSWNKETWDRYGRATLGLRYRASDRLNFGFNGIVNTGNNSSFFYWADSEANALIGNDGSFSKNKLLRFNIDPFVTYFDEKGNRHKLLSRIYRVDNEAQNNQGNQSSLFYGEYQYQRKWEEIGLVLTTGILASNTNISAQLYGDLDLTNQNAAAYVQVEKKFFDKLNIGAGMRYEYNNTKVPDDILSLIENDTLIENDILSEGKPIFRLGANYQISDYTYLRASWGQGYRFPTIAEKFINTDIGFPLRPNYNLKSETGWSTEIGIKQGFRISNWEGFVDVAAYWSQYFDMMEFTFFFNALDDFGFRSENIGNTDIKGMDFSVMGQGELFSCPTTLIAGYTYVDPKFQEFDADYDTNIPDNELTPAQLNNENSSADFNILKYRFKHTWKFDVESRIGPMSIAVAGFYNSHMEAVDALFDTVIPGLTEYRAANNQGSTVFDVRLAYHFGEKNKLSFLAKNIFNEEYTLRPALIEAPRNFTLKFEKTF